MVQTWNSIIENGLDLQEKSALMEKYPVPKNAPLLGTPKLNDILEKMISDSVKQRDVRLMQLQAQIGTSISAIGLAITSILNEEGGGGDRPYIKSLCDAGRLLTDVFHIETSARKELACYNLERSTKETLLAAPTDEWLFGSDVDKRLEASKQMERAIKSFKPINRPTETKKIPKQNLNFRSLSQEVRGGYRGRRQHYQPRSLPYGHTGSERCLYSYFRGKMPS